TCRATTSTTMAAISTTSAPAAITPKTRLRAVTKRSISSALLPELVGPRVIDGAEVVERPLERGRHRIADGRGVVDRPSGILRDAHIRRQQRQREPARELPVDDVRAEHVAARERLPRGVVEDVDHDLRVEAESLARDERFGGGRERGAGDEVVEGLHRVPRAEPAGAVDAVAHRLDD